MSAAHNIHDYLLQNIYIRLWSVESSYSVYMYIHFEVLEVLHGYPDNADNISPDSLSYIHVFHLQSHCMSLIYYLHTSGIILTMNWAQQRNVFILW